MCFVLSVCGGGGACVLVPYQGAGVQRLLEEHRTQHTPPGDTWMNLQ